MVDMSYILFICVAAPIILMIPSVTKESRKAVVFVLVGMCTCLFASELNGLFLKLTSSNMLYFTTNISPCTEEIIKALPIFFYALFVSDDQKNLLTIAFATGVGFAILENLIILTQNFDKVDIVFAVIRGFCSGLMHSICTMMISIFISMVHKKKKLFRIGTLAFLCLAIVYHSIFNALIQADSAIANYAGFFLPIVAYFIAFVLIPTSRFITVKKSERVTKKRT